LIVFVILTVTKPEMKIMGISIYSLRIPCLLLSIMLFLFGVPMLVTGLYYGSWSKKYDITGGCDDLPLIVPQDPMPTSVFLTPVNMTIAYVGDSGGTEESLSVYALIADENAEAMIHVGDFDYCDDPTMFNEQLNAVLGPDFPIIPIFGNHELHVWGEYAEVLGARWENITGDYLQCNGTLFANYWCIYRGLFIAFSSVGTKCGDGYRDYQWHEEQLDLMLTASDEFNVGVIKPWITCAWHKNQEYLQVGEKSDETGYGVYDICRDKGALIVTGHDHNYARTHSFDNVETQVVKDPCLTTRDGVCLYDLYDSAAIVTVVGLGGHEKVELNTDISSLPYWAAAYDQASGALFCKYNYNGDSSLAYCYFKTIDGDVIDEFYYKQRVPN